MLFLKTKCVSPLLNYSLGETLFLPENLIDLNRKNVSRVSRSATKLRSDLVNYLRSNPATPDGTHFSDFVNLGDWDTYLRRNAMDGKWGDWIVLYGLINMLQLLIPVEIVSSLGETGSKDIYPADCQNEAQATGDYGLTWPRGINYHSLEPMASQNPQLATAEELK